MRTEPRPVRQRGHDLSLPDDVLVAIRDAYDLGEWVSYERTPKGLSNVTYFVTTDSGRYALRRSKRRKTEAGLAFELRVIRHLRDNGFPAPEPVRTRDGEEFLSYDDNFYIVTNVIPGTAYEPGNPAHLAAVGRALARYHQIVSTFPLDGDESASPILAPILSDVPLVPDREEVEARAVRHLSHEERWSLSDALDALEGRFERIRSDLRRRYDGLGKLVVHGSMGRSAVLFDGRTLMGVIDYDRVNYDVRILDVAYTLKAFARINDHGDPAHKIGLDRRRFRSVLVGYLGQELLGDDEVEALPTVFCAQRLLKVKKKCRNLIEKGMLKPQKEKKDIEKLAGVVGLESGRVRWLERHAPGLVADAIERVGRRA